MIAYPTHYHVYHLRYKAQGNPSNDAIVASSRPSRALSLLEKYLEENPVTEKYPFLSAPIRETVEWENTGHISVTPGVIYCSWDSKK